jgi:hypothetical protein
MAAVSYARHQFPRAIIQHAVWLYLRFSLSYRDVRLRGVALSGPPAAEALATTCKRGFQAACHDCDASTEVNPSTAGQGGNGFFAITYTPATVG